MNELEHGPSHPAASPGDARARVRVGMVSVVAGVAIFAAKLGAWWVTGSAAVLSDALESIVNVVAASFALFALRFAADPADEEHPYGHGKIEHMSAAFEGGLVTFAAAAILFQGVRALIVGVELQQLDVGLWVTGAAGLANLALGAFLVSRGKALGSPAIIADGRHVLSDVWTTVGVLIGLLLVRLTGILWLDPVAAVLVGLLLARTGLKLVREAAGGLLDETDPELIGRLCRTFDEEPVPGIIVLHHLRVLHHGDIVHVDAHAYAPEHWTVKQAHVALGQLEDRFLAALDADGDVALHFDPCKQARCPECDLPECPVRRAPFVQRRASEPHRVGGPPPAIGGEEPPEAPLEPVG
ncbi:MAG: cation transporter [Alphaproteobacteria bacterium]|nr:cation transporter [Alphaproteobacteria bacterium]